MVAKRVSRFVPCDNVHIQSDMDGWRNCDFTSFPIEFQSCGFVGGKNLCYSADVGTNHSTAIL